MSFIDKLMFWKKENELGADFKFSDTSKEDLNSSNFENKKDPFQRGFGDENNSQDPFNSGRDESFYENHQSQDPFSSGALNQQASLGQRTPNNRGFTEELKDERTQHNNQSDILVNQTLIKDIEIISNKIDYIRAVTENINQRLAALERIAMDDNNVKRPSHNPRKPW